jgi:hypothetical protein
VDDLHEAILAFSRRNRRFGALDKTNTLLKAHGAAVGLPPG